jgi:DMSO/TMAO reductase YedYZ molybdopterin-dependent catalytic subunit
MTRETFLARRRLLRGSLGIGALGLLGGCDFSDSAPVQGLIGAASRWNIRVSEALFSGSRLAPTYPADRAVKDFRYNAWFGPDQAPVLAADSYRLQLAGMIADKRPWTVPQLYALPQVTEVTQHVCVEGWSMIGQWGGTPLATFLKRIGADTSARFVGFECADGYYESMDMPTALHPQTLMAFRLSGETLPRKYGYPFKIRVPTKLGFKNPKWVVTMFVTNRQPPGFWPDRGYDWFSGI